MKLPKSLICDYSAIHQTDKLSLVQLLKHLKQSPDPIQEISLPSHLEQVLLPSFADYILASQQQTYRFVLSDTDSCSLSAKLTLAQNYLAQLKAQLANTTSAISNQQALNLKSEQALAYLALQQDYHHQKLQKLSLECYKFHGKLTHNAQKYLQQKNAEHSYGAYQKEQQKWQDELAGIYTVMHAYEACNAEFLKQLTSISC